MWTHTAGGALSPVSCRPAGPTMSFAHYRRVKMEPDSYRGGVGLGPGGWGWGPASQTSVSFNWFRGFHQDDSVKVQPALATSLTTAPLAPSHSPDSARSGVNGHKASRNEASYGRRTPPGGHGQLPPPPGITGPSLFPLAPRSESTSAGSSSGSSRSCSGLRLGTFSSPDSAQQHSGPTGNVSRKPGPGHAAGDSSTSSSDVMLGHWTSSNVSNAGMATSQCQATTPTSIALSVHSVPLSSTSAMGAFAGEGSSVGEYGGGVVGVSRDGDATCAGYDNARATFFIPSGQWLFLSACIHR